MFSLDLDTAEQSAPRSANGGNEIAAGAKAKPKCSEESCARTKRPRAARAVRRKWYEAADTARSKRATGPDHALIKGNV